MNSFSINCRLLEFNEDNTTTKSAIKCREVSKQLKNIVL